MRVKITSDGTAFGTRVVDAESGEPIERVTSVSWSVDMERMVASANVTFVGVPVEIKGELEETFMEPPATDETG